MKKFKFVGISEEDHATLKNYCDEHGHKMGWMLSKLIKENCSTPFKVLKSIPTSHKQPY